MPDRDLLFPATIFFGRGENTHPDPEALEKGELQSSLRTRSHKGLLYVDKGTAQYGSSTDGAASPGGLWIHKHPTAPRLLVAVDGDLKYDSAGDGSAWTDIVTGLTTGRRFSFAGQQGLTLIANGRDKTLRYQGGSAATELAELPGPEDCPPMEMAPYPSDSFIDQMEDKTNWTASGCTATDEDYIKFQGEHSMKVVTNGAAPYENVKRDFGGSTFDLSDTDYLGFWIYATQAGTKLSLGITEDDPFGAADWDFFPITIGEEDVGKWVLRQWDIRTIDPDDRDAIRGFVFFTNQALATTFYLDHFMYAGGLAGEYAYAVSFYDSATRNQGPIGLHQVVSTVAAGEEQAVAPARSIVFPSRPVYLPDGADRVRLYRTMSGAGGRYFHIADITPAANAWSYTDNTPDRELGEAEALNVWPGQCPRAAHLIPRGDRLWHVGGLFCGSRNENPTTAVDALNLASETMVRGPFPPAPVFAVEVKVGTGQTGTMTLALQRQAKGAGWGAPTTVATGSLNQAFANDTWYQFQLTPSGNEDIYFSDEYDYRVIVTARPAGLTAYQAWVASGSHLAYRLLVRADNAIFISNLAEPDRVPPLGQYEHEPDQASGGFVTLASNDGETIETWVENGSDLLVRKQTRTYIVVGTNTDDYDDAPALPSYGGREQGTEVDCDGDSVWMAQDRQIYLWRAGQQVVHLSKPIEEFFLGLTEAQVAGACACYFDRRYFLWLPAAPAGSRSRVYDFDERAWSRGYDGQIYDVLPKGPAETFTEPWALEYIGAAYGIRKVFYGTADGGGNITWSGRSREERFAEEVQDASWNAVKRVRMFHLVCQGTAADTIDVAFYVNGASSPTRSYALTIPAGTGVKRIRGHPDSDILGRTISAKVSGAHDTETIVHRVELELELVR